MSKSKIILMALGGAILLVVLVMLGFIWSAASAKTVALEGDDDEGIEGLESVIARVERISGGPVYPCAENVQVLVSNRQSVVAWTANARAQMAAGDRKFEPTTTAAFKAFIVADATRLTGLLGVPNDFGFGPFKAYIAEGKMPAEGELAALQRRWNDVATIVEILSESGIVSLNNIQFKETSSTEEVSAEETPAARRAKARQQKNQAAEAVAKPSAFSYVFTLTAKPSAFVKAVNALSSTQRFIVIDDFSLTRPTDFIGDALAGDEKKAASGAAARRAAKRRAANGDGNEKKGDTIVDPMTAEPLKVVLSLTVFDFRSREWSADDGNRDNRGGAK